MSPVTTPPIWLSEDLKTKLRAAGIDPDRLVLLPPTFSDGKRHVIEYREPQA